MSLLSNSYRDDSAAWLSTEDTEAHTPEILPPSLGRGQSRLGDDGRLVIRKSGTEPVIRVMAEGEDEDLIDSVVKEICQALHTFAAGNGVERLGSPRLDALSAQAAE